MAWVILEGLDRTGKSTVAEIYKKKGYEVVHMSAPDKKYKQPGYAGPSYLDDMLELYLQYDGKDVIFDRSVYGEFVWPHVYGREPMLADDELEVLQEFEERNETDKILMIDPDVNAHWKRCVDNKEPMNQNQFRIASALFNKLAHKYNFIPKQLKDFQSETKDNKQAGTTTKQEPTIVKGQVKDGTLSASISSGPEGSIIVLEEEPVTELEKLEKANAIRDVLSKRILKQKGGAFDKLEDDIKTFLQKQLSSIFKDQGVKDTLTAEEILILKTFCQRLKEKETARK